jgi:hypothetical protein
VGKPMVYFLEAVGQDLVKVGTSAEPLKRLAALRSVVPGETRLLRLVEGGRELEHAYHVMWAAHRVRGEWFRLSPIREEVSNLTPIRSESQIRAALYADSPEVIARGEEEEILLDFRSFDMNRWDAPVKSPAASNLACCLRRPHKDPTFFRRLTRAIDRGSLLTYATGKRQPTIEEALFIEELTQGEVALQDWADMERVRRNLEEEL